MYQEESVLYDALSSGEMNTEEFTLRSVIMKIFGDLEEKTFSQIPSSKRGGENKTEVD